jgi:hypothetical protein
LIYGKHGYILTGKLGYKGGDWKIRRELFKNLNTLLKQQLQCLIEIDGQG